MFINLSNHPADRWSAEQRDAAQALGGEIVDVPFPNIDPNASHKDVNDLARKIFDQIVNDAVAVHVAGESTFVYTFVRMCQSVGIPCFAATTERMVVENPDGTKTVAFEFKQFRPYFQ